MAFTVVAYGEALWDLLPSGAVLGGAPLNFAYRVSSLGNRGVIISRLGKDDLGRKAFEQISRLEMETGFVQWDESLPTYRVELEDSCGSGDAFTAGFINCLLGGTSLRRACEFGNAMGALVAGQRGATQPVSVQEIDALINKAEPGYIDSSLEEFMT